MNQIKYGCQHGSFFEPPFGKDGCKQCEKQATERFQAAKMQHFKMRKSNNNPSDFSTYYFDVVVNEDENLIRVGTKVDVEYWTDYSGEHFHDKSCKLADEGSISHILANCFAEYTDENDEIVLREGESETRQQEKIEEIILHRIAPYANELWSLIFHFRSSIHELVQFVKKDVLKKKSEMSSSEKLQQSSSKLEEQYGISSLNRDDSLNYGMLGFGVASDMAMPGDFADLTDEDMMVCYMLYGQEGLNLMKENSTNGFEDMPERTSKDYDDDY